MSHDSDYIRLGGQSFPFPGFKKEMAGFTSLSLDAQKTQFLQQAAELFGYTDTITRATYMINNSLSMEVEKFKKELAGTNVLSKQKEG